MEEGSGQFADRPVLDVNSPMPRYLQVRDWLIERIRTGDLIPGDKLPAEKDWAPELGVSQMTLNHAIQALVRDGLIVREVGRGTFVSTGRSPQPAHIGLVLHWQKDSDGGHYGTEMLQGIYHTAANRPVRFSFAWGARVGDEPSEYYAQLASSMHAAGLILVIPPANALPHILALQETGLPFVLVGASWGSYDLPSVDFDNAKGIEMATRHLLEMGHRRIGLVNGAMYLRSSQTRTSTFHRVLAEAGVDFDPAWEITSSSFTMDAPAAKRLLHLLKTEVPPTAFVAAGYYLSLQTVEMVQSLGRRIPQDVSVVGFGDPLSARYLSPPLTTIRHPIEALGELAATRLLEDAARGSASRGADLLPVEFVLRDSTAPYQDFRVSSGMPAVLDGEN